MSLRWLGAAAVPGATATLLAQLLGGCAAETSAPAAVMGTGTKLTPAAEQLLEALVTQIETNAARVVKNATAQEATAVYSLLGSSEGKGNDAHLAMPCASEQEAQPTCGSDLPGNELLLGMFDTCFVTGCKAANVAYVDVYVTSAPHRTPDDRVTLSYALTAPFPKGMATYDPNPLTRWTTDATDPNAVRVHADLENSVHVRLEGQGALDFSYEGTVDGTNTRGQSSMTLSLTLPQLTAAGPVHVSLMHFSNAPTQGNIMTGDKTLADISESKVIWRPQ